MTARMSRRPHGRVATLLATILVFSSGMASPAWTGDQQASAGSADSESVFQTVPDDPTAVVLGSDEFPVHGDGLGDDSAVLQSAIDEASRRGGENWWGNIVGGARDVNVGDGGGVVFIPEGTYRISETLDLHDSVRLIGFGEKRPTIFLGPNTPGFQEGTESYVIATRRFPYEPGKPLAFGSSDTFGTGLMNLNLEIGAGNPAAVGVRFRGAQLFLMQDVDIDVGDGYAGVDRNANLMQRVNVRGGQIGLKAFASSPGWQTTVLDSSFEGQREAAITLATDAKLTIMRTRFSDVPNGIVTDWPNQWQHLYVQDSVFENIADAAITLNDSESIPPEDEVELIQAQNQLNVLNSGVSDTGALLRLTPSGQTWSGPGASYLVDEATLGLRVEDALTDTESRSDEILVAARRAASAGFDYLLASDIPLPPGTDSWVNIADYAAEHGVSIGSGVDDDHAIFQQAIDEHDTIYVPMGQYLIADTLELRPSTNLIGLHPRQTWLMLADGHPDFSDPDNPKAMVSTPPGGRNIVMGLGLDSAEDTAGSVHVHWKSGVQSHLADITTQFIKWHPEETEPGDPGPGDPGYQYRGTHKYSFWIEGGGGTFANLWSVAGWAENGLLIENTSVPGRMYQVSVEHHKDREVVLRNVQHWAFHALQTEDHIYGWRSQAVELDRTRDVLLANNVFFRVATVQGPYPYSVGIRDSADVIIRGTRGYRPVNVENTRWGATIADVDSGRTVPELEVAYLGLDVEGGPAQSAGTQIGLSPSSVGALPGESVEGSLPVRNDGPDTIRDLRIDVDAPDGWEADASFDVVSLLPGETAEGRIEVRVPHGADITTEEVVLAVAYRRGVDNLVSTQTLKVQVGGENLAFGANVQASSVLGSNDANNAVNGVVDGPRWISAPGDPLPTLTIDIGAPADVRLLRLYSGFDGSIAHIVRGMVVEAGVDGEWVEIGRLAENTSSPVDIDLSDAPRGLQELRLVFTGPSNSDDIARVYEIEIYGVRPS